VITAAEGAISAEPRAPVRAVTSRADAKPPGGRGHGNSIDVVFTLETRDIDATVQGEGTDLGSLDRVRRLVREIGAALDDSTRAKEFEALLERV
jgi:hypothetical protein